jgi:putative polyhydroxyalkanoate system protein
MATIDIRRAHSFSNPEAKSRAERLATSLQQELGIRWHWEIDKIRFDTLSGMIRGATGQVDIDSNAIRVAVDLPYVLRPLKSKIEAQLTEKLDACMR